MLTGRFDKQMEKIARQDAIRNLRSQLDAKDTFSARKKDILNLILNYAEECLTGFFTLQLNANRFQDVISIFENATLDDIMFMQHVANRLVAIEDHQSRLRSQVLPRAVMYRDALLAPSVAQIRKICIAGAFLAACSGQGTVCILAIIGAMAAHQLALSRLQSALENKRNESLLQGDVPQIGDGLDRHLTEGGQAANRLLQSAATHSTSMANQAARLFSRSSTERGEQPLAPSPTSREALPAPTMGT